jgi:hypothetical protein
MRHAINVRAQYDLLLYQINQRHAKNVISFAKGNGLGAGCKRGRCLG